MSLDVHLRAIRPTEFRDAVAALDDYARDLQGEDAGALARLRELVRDLKASAPTTEVFHANVTHNLNNMAAAAGIYEVCWRPDEIGLAEARQLIDPLREGVAWLRANEAAAREHDAPNGWGRYEHFLPWVESYLAACEADPDATVTVSR